jgi:hypothetical protein
VKVRFELLLQRLGAVASLVLLLSSPAVWAQANAPGQAEAPAQANAPAQASAETPEPLPADKEFGNAKTSSLEGGAFQLEVPVWKPKTHAGPPTALLAKYEWSGKGERTASAVRVTTKGKPDTWRISFPDQPKPDELARITLFYTFELTPADQKLLRDATAGLIDAVTDAAADAADQDDGNFVERFTQTSRALAASAHAKTLRQYGDEAGNDGLTLVLQQLGITLRPEGGWGLTVQARESLVAHSSDELLNRVGAQNAADAMVGLLERMNRATPSAAALARCSLGDDPSKLDTETAKQAIVGCASLLEAELRRAAEGEADAEKKALLLDAANALKAAAPQGAPAVLAARKSKLSKVARVVPAIRDGFAYNATLYALYVTDKTDKDAAWNQRVEQLKSRITALVEQTSRVEVGSLLVAGGVQPRRYDIATGAVFVSGIKDIVTPMLISICPAAGCLEQDEVAWSAPMGWWRALSVDAGIRVKTLDTQDARQSDTLSFLLGVSYNPVTVLRISVGGYAFENAQERKHWNLVPYTGITFNILNAAELLGGLGLSSQFEPQQVTPN